MASVGDELERVTRCDIQPEYFIFLGEFHEIALIASLFIAMLNEMKLMKVLDSWVEMCEDDGKTGVVI